MRPNDLKLIAVSTVGAAAVAMALSTTAVAQQASPEAAKPTVRGEVNVGAPGAKPAAPAAASAPGSAAAPGGAAPTATAATSDKPVKRVWARNPFVPPTVSASPKSVAKITPATPKKAPGPTGPKKPVSAKPEVVKVNPPTFALVGLLTSGSYNRALVVSSTGARELRVGDKIDGFTVKGIDKSARVVLVEMNKQSFKVGLPADNAGPGGAKSAAPGAGQGSPQGMPPGGMPPGGAPQGGPSSGAPLPPPPPPSGGGAQRGMR